jgi:hypothetical protein
MSKTFIEAAREKVAEQQKEAGQEAIDKTAERERLEKEYPTMVKPSEGEKK